MHLHLKDSLSDYGPVYAFWCFAFERFNGVLGSYQTNNRQIEPQIMCKLLGERGIHNIPLPQMYNPFLQLLPSAQKGSLRYATCSGEGVTKLMELSSPRPPIALWITVHREKKRYYIAPLSEKIMSSDLYKQICKVYTQLYPNFSIQFVPRTYIHSRRATLGGELLVAASFNKKYSVVASFWPGFGDSIDRLDPAMKRVGTIMFFLSNIEGEIYYKY